jgi:hypothetical protein
MKSFAQKTPLSPPYGTLCMYVARVTKSHTYAETSLQPCMNSCNMRMLQALGLLDGTWEPTKAKTRSKTDSDRTWRDISVTNAPPDMRVDIKQHEHDLTLVLPRAWDSILSYGFLVAFFAAFGVLWLQMLPANAIDLHGITGDNVMCIVFIVLSWCVPSRPLQLFLFLAGQHPTREGFIRRGAPTKNLPSSWNPDSAP